WSVVGSVFRIAYCVKTEHATRNTEHASRFPSFLARQAASCIGVKLLVGDGLDADDCGYAEDVVGVGAAGDIRRRSIQPEEDLTVGVGAGNVLQQFAGDIPGIEFWKNEDGGVARHFALGRFSMGDVRYQGGIDLQLTVKVRIQTFFVRLLLRESRRR